MDLVHGTRYTKALAVQAQTQNSVSSSYKSAGVTRSRRLRVAERDDYSFRNDILA
jgi:hypothetical protein